MKTDLQRNNLNYFLNQLEKLGVKIDRENLSLENIENQIEKVNKRNLLFKHGYTWTTVWQAPVVTLSEEEGEEDTIIGLDYYWNINLGFLTVDLLPFINVHLVQDDQEEDQNITMDSTSGMNFYVTPVAKKESDFSFDLEEGEEDDFAGIVQVTLNYSLYLKREVYEEKDDVEVFPKNSKLIVFLANPT